MEQLSNVLVSAWTGEALEEKPSIVYRVANPVQQEEKEQAEQEPKETGNVELFKAIKRVGVSIALLSLWGFCAASSHPSMAAANLLKVPMTVVVSVLVALPAALAAGFVLGVKGKWQEIARILSKSLLRASVVLGAFAPLILIYAYSSRWFAQPLAQASCAIALLCGVIALGTTSVRGMGLRWKPLVVVTMFAILHGLALVQLMSIAAPILPEKTAFSAGLDGWWGR